MKTYIAGFLFGFLVALLATPLVRRVSFALGFVDQPDPERKIHVAPIPRTGGVVLLAAVLLPLASFYFFQDRAAVGAVLMAPGNLRGIFLGAVLVCGLGLVDDVRGMHAGVKLLGQAAIALIMYVFEFRIDVMGNPFGAPIDLGWACLPATVIWYVAVMNAMNLIDGLDGLASGLGLVTTLVLFASGVFTGNSVLGTVSAILAGSLAGFLVFNFNPARIFLGDSGSLLLGFLLATFSIMARSKGQTAVALFMPALALGVPFLDVALSVLRRVASRRPLFQGDRKHIHHLLLERGYSPRKVALILYGVAGFFGLVALSSMLSQDATATVVLLVALLGAVIVLVRFLGYHQMAWLSRGEACRLDSPEAVRLREMIQELVRLPSGRGWQDFGAVMMRHGLQGFHVFQRDGQNRHALFSMDGAVGNHGPASRLTASFQVPLPDGKAAEMLFQWAGEPGRFAVRPHEEAMLRVVADLVQTLPWPPPAAATPDGSP